MSVVVVLLMVFVITYCTDQNNSIQNIELSKAYLNTFQTYHIDLNLSCVCVRVSMCVLVYSEGCVALCSDILI